MKINRSGFVKAAAAAAIALAALGTASVAEARGNVFFSIGANVAPGVTLGVSNAPYYAAPAYYAPAPVYYQPAPVYYEPAPVYYQPAVYYAAPVITVGRPYYRHHGRHWR
ncbi:hypothetical protein ACFPOE_15475 [Caenimonas terrae]|uniref:Twin-arginine translocation signal domain-containing protein n=1 Tax=Caenimonas terrae TaxID=696074 RepID=A0ABW0NGA3_9BURK